MNIATSAATRKIVVGSTVAALALSAAALAMIPSALRGMFSQSFLPHVFCYRFNKQLIPLHVVSDSAIWLSYLGISCTLVYLVWRTRREIPFTHFMEVVVLWK